jgi:hypothetical protein
MCSKKKLTTEQNDMGDRIISQILQLTKKITSDSDRAIVLTAIANKYAENR